jgi:hypothetical protein
VSYPWNRRWLDDAEYCFAAKFPSIDNDRGISNLADTSLTPGISIKVARTALKPTLFLWRKWLLPAFYATKRWARPRPRRIFLWSFVLGVKVRTSWGEIEHFVRRENVKLQRINPDVVIGTGVGGGILAALIAGNCAHAKFYAVERQVRWTVGERHVELFGLGNKRQASKEIKDKVVVLAAAELVSAQTTIQLRALIEVLQPKAIFILCLDLHSTSKIPIPDFVYDRIAASGDKPNLIQKPWRIVNSYRSGDEGQRP